MGLGTLFIGGGGGTYGSEHPLPLQFPAVHDVGPDSLLELLRSTVRLQQRVDLVHRATKPEQHAKKERRWGSGALASSRVCVRVCVSMCMCV